MNFEDFDAAAQNVKIPDVPSNFKQIICDLTADLNAVYPEYSASWAKWNSDMSEEELTNLFQYCLLYYPARFFDILNKNETIFQNESETETKFLPNVEFKALYNCSDISQNTRDTIWKYLQLILFSVVQAMNDSSLFGETAKIFENINTDDLKTKLDEAFQNIEQLFSGMNMGSGAEAGADADTAAPAADAESDSDDIESDEDTPRRPRFENPFSKFDAEKMHSHINELLNGKIGVIAKELAEEISHEINDDLMNMMDGQCTGNMMNDTQAFLGKLKENPGKMMDLVKKIVGKLRAKMDKGDISQEDLMRELSGIMDKLKSVPGFGGMESILKQFARGMGGAGAGARVDTNAVERMSNQQKMKEKLRARMESKKRAQVEAAFAAAQNAAAIQAAAATAAPTAPIDESWMDEPVAAAPKSSAPKSKKSGGGGKKKK